MGRHWSRQVRPLFFDRSCAVAANGLWQLGSWAFALCCLLSGQQLEAITFSNVDSRVERCISRVVAIWGLAHHDAAHESYSVCFVYLLQSSHVACFAHVLHALPLAHSEPSQSLDFFHLSRSLTRHHGC